jgi:hypothetical protein
MEIADRNDRPHETLAVARVVNPTFHEATDEVIELRSRIGSAERRHDHG